MAWFDAPSIGPAGAACSAAADTMLSVACGLAAAGVCVGGTSVDHHRGGLRRR